VLVSIAPGPQTFALGDALAEARGARLTAVFSVTPPSGAAAGTVVVSNLVLDNASSVGLRFVRPTLLLVGASDETLGQVGFNDVDFTVPAGRKSPFPKLSMVIDGYQTGAKLRLVFGALSTTTSTAIEGLSPDMYVECKSPATFSAVATHWTQNNCRNCHAGLFPFDFLGSDNATACGLSKKLLGPQGPNLARAAQGGHAGGTIPNAGAYTNALNAWRNAER
jgi:hypothetical protein